MRLWIRNGRVIDPATKLDAVQDLWIADGRIIASGSAPVGFEAERTIDADGLVVCPGLVDLCARLREPGQEHKATIASETAAAAAAGIGQGTGLDRGRPDPGSGEHPAQRNGGAEGGRLRGDEQRRPASCQFSGDAPRHGICRHP